MTGRVNDRGWIVLESIASNDGGLCVDFFKDPDGGFGFEHFRADPEDQGRWTVLGAFSGIRYETPLLAATTALDAVAWLKSEFGARRSFDRWRSTLSPER